MGEATERNPLLDDAGLPAFDRIEPRHVVPGTRHLLGDLRTDLETVEAGAAPTWAATIEPIERLSDRLSRSWGTVTHLMGVRNSDDLRTAHESVQPEVVEFSMRLGQSRPLYRALRDLRGGTGWNDLDGGRRRLVESLVRDAELSGVGLEGEHQTRFNAIQTELAELSTKFSNHVLDATKAFALDLQDPAEAEGLPASLRALAAQAARQAGNPEATPDDGPWRITLDLPSYLPFLQHSPRRDLRERLYRAYVSRASEGELRQHARASDRILELRREQAALLGFEELRGD